MCVAATCRWCISAAARCPGPRRSFLRLSSGTLLGWRGIFVLIGVCALIVWVLRFNLPESPRWLATHGKGDAALKILPAFGIAGPPPGVGTRDDGGERYQKRSALGGVLDLSQARADGDACLFRLLRRRHDIGHLHARHHGRPRFRHHQGAAIHARHDAVLSAEQPVHDVVARSYRPHQDRGRRLHTWPAYFRCCFLSPLPTRWFCSPASACSSFSSSAAIR